MKALIYYELKKTFGITKTLICAMAVVALCTTTFFGFMSNVGYFENEEVHDAQLEELSGEITEERIAPYNKVLDEVAKNPKNLEIDENGSHSVKQEIAEKYALYEQAHHFGEINARSKDTSALEALCKSGDLTQNERLLVNKNIAMLNQKGNMIAGKNIFFEANLSFLTYVSFQLLSILVIFFLAPIFTKEYSSKMDGILLSSKNGKRNLIRAKLITAGITTLSIYVATLGYFALLSAIVLGVEGANTSFNAYLFDSFPFINSPYDLTALEYFVRASAISFIGGLSLASLVMLISSLLDKILLSFVMPFLVVFTPWFLNETLGGDGGVFDHLMQYAFFNVIRVAPLYDHFAGIVVFGHVIMEKDVIVAFTVITMLICGCFSAKVFRRHQVKN